MRKTYVARKVYVLAYGDIPTDENGRKYEIHHIDGNKYNNDPKNLKALSIEEHYNLHLQQGDYAAAHRIAGRMNIPAEKLSKIASLRNKKLVEEGKHNWQGGKLQSKLNKKRVDEGTHNFLGGKYIKEQYAQGKPPWGSKEEVSKRTQEQLKQGRHPWQGKNKPMMECPNCGKIAEKPNIVRWHLDKCKWGQKKASLNEDV